MLTKITPDAFQAAFGAPMEQAADLLATKTLSISKLMLLMPPGTPDPTPHIYDTTMYALSGLMAVAFLSHAMVRPLAATASTTTNRTIDVKESVSVDDKAAAEVTTAVVPTAVDEETKAGDRQMNKK